VVPLHLGGRVRMGSGDAGRGPGFLPVAAAGGQAGAGSLADRPSGRARLRASAGDGERGDREGFAGPGIRGRDGRALRDGLPFVLRLSPGGGVRAAGQPVPAGQEERPGACAPEPAGAVPEGTDRTVPAPAAETYPAGHPGPAVRRAVRVPAVAPGPGPGRVLGLHGRAGRGTARRHRRVHGPRQPARHGDPQGIAGGAAAAGVAGRVRVAASLPGGDARPGAVPAGRPGVVDAAAPVPAAVVSRGPRDAHPGGCVAGGELVAARHPAYRMARDPEMPITDVQWVLGHVHLSTTQIYVTPTAEDVIASVAGHHRRRAERPAPPPPPAGPGYRPESLDVLFGGRG